MCYGYYWSETLLQVIGAFPTLKIASQLRRQHIDTSSQITENTLVPGHINQQNLTHTLNIIVAILLKGTRSFVAKNMTLIEDCRDVLITCNKDTVGKRCLQKWSRGMFIIATAGGHIDYWQPLYK